jgi:hypothetical protein
MRLTVDQWDPDYGASVELEEELGPAGSLQLAVECAGSWAPIPAPGGREAADCAFVDGVRRIDARLFAQEGELTVAALAGSWAVGCARSGTRPAIDGVRVGRELIVGGGLQAPSLQIEVGHQRLVYGARAVAGAGSVEVLRGLQNAMRAAEAEVAAAVLADGQVELVVADGPLSYAHHGPLLGMVKRQARAYLDGERARVLGRLGVGERTPIFKIGEGAVERYSWYLRIASRRPVEGDLTGLVRLEVAGSLGLSGAQRLAAIAATALPRFAARPGYDARAPQNLYPIGALEGLLRHHLGDQTLIRRALEARLLRELDVG